MHVHVFGFTWHWAAFRGMNRAPPPTLNSDSPLIDPWWEVSEGSSCLVNALTPPGDCVWLMKLHSLCVLHLLKVLRFYWAIGLDITNRSQIMLVSFRWTSKDSTSCSLMSPFNSETDWGDRLTAKQINPLLSAPSEDTAPDSWKHNDLQQGQHTKRTI